MSRMKRLIFVGAMTAALAAGTAAPAFGTVHGAVPADECAAGPAAAHVANTVQQPGPGFPGQNPFTGVATAIANC